MSISTVREPVEDIDSLLRPLGTFGKFQIITLLHIATFITLSSISELSYVFTAGALKHRCLISECEDVNNASYNAPWIGSAIPVRSKDDTYEQCLRYKYKISASDISKCGNTSFTEETESCSTFVFETKERTIVREGWGINCEKDAWMYTLPGSLNNAGQFVGGLFAGFLSDRFGRKKMLVTATLICALIGFIKSFSVNYVMFTIFEFSDPMLASGLFTGSFVFALEAVEPKKRVIAGMLITCAYPLGEIIVGLVQMLTLYWRNTLRICYAPFLAVVISYWTLSESVRWLLVTNRKEEALSVVQTMARNNKKTIPEELIEKVKKANFNELSEGTSNLQEFRNMFKSRIMTLRVLNCTFGWIANTFVYFGLSLNAVNVNDDKFLNFILTALIEVPAYLTTYFILDRIGRRATQSISLLTAGVACAIFPYVPEVSSWAWAKLVLFLIGKFGISIGFVTLDVYTTEMFPTTIRHTTMGACQIFGKLASILAPQTPLLATIYKPLPLLLFSALSLVGGVLAWMFPETLNTVLPNTIEEAERLGQDMKSNKK